MNELADLLTEALYGTTFLTREIKTVSSEQLRNAYTDADGRNSAVRDTLSARPMIEGPCMDRLTAHLRMMLNRYVVEDIDYIGHSFDVMDGHPFKVTTTQDGAEQMRSTSTVSSFASSLVRAAAVLGPERAAQVLSEWSDGASLRFKVCIVLGGAHAVESFELNPGLRVYRLSLSSLSLPNSIPNIPMEVTKQILGRTVLEVDVFTSPALTVFPTEPDYPELQTCTVLAPARLDDLFVTLSLVCNQQVGMAWSWNDFGDARSFATGINTGWAGPGMEIPPLGGVEWQPWSDKVELYRFDPPPPNLLAPDLQRACGLLSELSRRMAADERFDVAVNRWMAAVSHDVATSDRVIDLRIALEALYVDSDQSELSFRLVTAAARHLRNNVVDRKAVRDTLRQFYSLASRIVHGAAKAKYSANDVALIEEATTLCRDGILKILEDRYKPESWNDFLLD